MVDIAEKVNPIIKESFGNGFRGNYSRGITSADTPGFFFKDEELDLIAKQRWFSIPFLFEAFEIVGRFKRQDGSELEIFPQFIDSALKYASQYELLFKKRVNLRYIN